MGISNGWMLNMDESEIDQITAACAMTNTLYFRSDFAWSDVQWEGSESWNWSNIDRVVSSSNKEGLALIAILDYFPPWASVSTDTTFWYDFVYQAGLRYIPQGVVIYEIWNEPNITNFWPEPNVQDYVQNILIPGSNAIRKAASDLNTSVTVISGGLAPAATDGNNISQLDFVQGIYDNGGKNHFDALGQHPYCWPLDPSIPNTFNWFLNTEQLRNIMIKNGDGHKKIWGTEMGWPTSNPNSNGVSESDQARFLSSSYGLWNNWDWTGPLIWYAYNDAGTNFENPEDNFGLVRNDFSSKVALDSFLMLSSNCSDNIVGSSEFESNDHSLKVFPNPVSKELNINGLDLTSKVSIFNISGILVQEAFPSSENLSLNLAFFPNGIYFIKVVKEDEKVLLVKRLVKK